MIDAYTILGLFLCIIIAAIVVMILLLNTLNKTRQELLGLLNAHDAKIRKMDYEIHGRIDGIEGTYDKNFENIDKSLADMNNKVMQCELQSTNAKKDVATLNYSVIPQIQKQLKDCQTLCTSLLDKFTEMRTEENDDTIAVMIPANQTEAGTVAYMAATEVDKDGNQYEERV